MGILPRRLLPRLTKSLSAVALVAVGTTGLSLVSAGPASAVPVLTPAQAVARGVANAAPQGITQYVCVIDRTTGKVLAETANANTQVASESIVKLFTATAIIVRNGGYQDTSASTLNRLAYMIEYSDDATETALFDFQQVPQMAARYGLADTNNGTDPWGAVHITAHDMATFLFEVLRDPEVGPWLTPVMAQVKPNGSDGYDQHFGFNALGGVHGSKQGWGFNNFSAQTTTIHSVGYTDKYVGAILQTGDDGTYYTMHATATYTAQLIQASSVVLPTPYPRLPAAAAVSYVSRLFTTLLGRSVAAPNNYTVGLEAGLSSKVIVAKTLADSLERRNHLVEVAYHACLGRSADLAGLRARAAYLATGTLTGLYSMVCGSAEAFRRAGRSDRTWVAQTYRAILGRTASAGEQSGQAAVVARKGLVTTAAGITGSPESERRLTDSLYRVMLGRGVDSAGLRHFGPSMPGRGEFTVAVSVAISPEFAAKA